MYFIGIDWATEKHDICVMDDNGNIVRQLTMTQDLLGFQKLAQIVSDYDLDNVQLNIERSDGLLVDWISQQGWPLHVTATLVVARRRPRRSKSDLSDAYLLAYLLRLKDPDCRPLTRSSPKVLHLRELVRALDTTIADQRRLANRLRYALLQYFPVATHLFAHVESLICLSLLEAYPTPEAARALSHKEMGQFLRTQGYRYRDRIDHIYSQLQQPMPTAVSPQGYVVQVQMLIPLLRTLHHTRHYLEKEIAAVFATHPEANWWRSFPGAQGMLTPARLLAWIGDDRRRFPSAETLQAVSGTAPVTRRSGKALRVEFRRACSHPLRKAVSDLARQSVKHSSWAQAYLDAQLARGHNRSRAYRGLANRWMKIIWTLWQRGEWYNEAVHVCNREKHMGHQQLRTG